MPERVHLFPQASILVRPHSVLQICRADWWSRRALPPRPTAFRSVRITLICQRRYADAEDLCTFCILVRTVCRHAADPESSTGFPQHSCRPDGCESGPGVPLVEVPIHPVAESSDRRSHLYQDGRRGMIAGEPECSPWDALPGPALAVLNSPLAI